MPTTRKKVIKTVYEDEDDNEDETGDFSDSGSEAKISDASSSEDEEVVGSSGDEFEEPSKNKKVKSRSTAHVKVSRKPKFAKAFVNKINKQMSGENENEDIAPALISVKDLTDADKLLPSILNLSESDSSDDESSKPSYKKVVSTPVINEQCDTNSDPDDKLEFKDVWSSNMQDDSEEIAKKTFLELEKHQMKVEKTKLSLQTYMNKVESKESDVNDLLAMGEDVISTPSPSKKKITSHKRSKRVADDSESDVEDWEEVKESKAIPQQGLQLFVEFPNAPCRKNKKLDLDMMMKRKINRVKKEYQVYMHKVHVLSWLGHGNYISCVLNDQELMAAAISLVPSKECYPGERVDMKYVEQITSWYKDKLTLKQDKHEDKFRPKAPPLKDILLGQIKRREVTTRKYLVFIFIAMLRAIGLQCRVMFNFVTLPLKPHSSELCSLSSKLKDEKPSDTSKSSKQPSKEGTKSAEKKKRNPRKVKAQIPQVDGNYDSYEDSANDNIMQLDGSDDTLRAKATRRTRSAKANDVIETTNQDVSPPKRSRKSPVKIINDDRNKRAIISNKTKAETNEEIKPEKSIQLEPTAKLPPSRQRRPVTGRNTGTPVEANKNEHTQLMSSRVRNTRSKNILSVDKPAKDKLAIDVQNKKLNPPKILITNENVSSKYFKEETQPPNTRKRSLTAKPKATESENKATNSKSKSRTKSAPGTVVEKSKYFNVDKMSSDAKKSKLTYREMKEASKAEDKLRVSHKDLVKPMNKNDVTNDLVNIIKNRVKEAKADSKKGIVKGKVKKESDCDSDVLPEEEPSCRQSESDDDFKPVKISPKPSTSRKIDRRVLSSDDDAAKKNKTDVWCEIFVEELEQWISVDVIRGKIHATNDIYMHATHPVCYVVGWDNNNYLKDLTRRYVPHWNTMTRKQRAEPLWWDKAVQPWLGPKTARDKEEDVSLDRMQLEAPLPKSIAEYKNHPLYALKRHLLKFEALYPPDAATLGFVRGEAVYARDCVYTCRSRDTWLKEAKVVRLAEVPYKVVKARPKWDKLSNKLITDKPLEVFGPWQVQDYEPPVAEDGIVPRNAYGNVELFKDCMLPKGTVHIKLPGLNKVARKLNIDCAPAMTGFDFNGGWSHPVYDGFVVCKEYEEIITEAWVKDQEDQERREREKIDARVYGSWRRIIKGLFIRERLKDKYGFQELSNVMPKTKSKGPRLVVKK